MTDASVTYTFTNATTADASEVNTNLSNILNFLNSTGVHVYQAGTVITAALANAAVTTAKIADGAVTRDKQAAVVKRKIGEIVFAAEATEENGLLLCDGQAVSRTTYSLLYAKIGTSFGSGDGSTTFNVPDLRGMALAGMDDMGTAEGAAGTVTDAQADSVGGSMGTETHTLTTDEMPAHTHTFTGDALAAHNHDTANSDPLYAINLADSGSGYVAITETVTASARAFNTSSDSAGTPSGTNSNTGGGSAHNIMQPTTFLPAFIYAGE